MRADSEAKLFYGYVEPIDDEDDCINFDYDEEQEADEKRNEAAWQKSHTARAHGCIGDLYGYDDGYDEDFRHFLAVEASLHKAAQSKICVLSPSDFTIQPEWDEQLQQAATHFGIDVSKLKPSWYVVSLSFRQR
jgi:hypothetical protein